MKVIPVIDVRGGVAVAARLGDRANYKPLSTPLASGSDPVAIARGLLELFPFETIYVADLDAIEGRGGNGELIDRLREAVPGVKLWIDSGMASVKAAGKLLERSKVCVVVGSESVTSLRAAESLFRLAPNHSVISLDLDGEGFIGPYELLTSPQVWPRSVIAMSIACVGSGDGPALEYVRDICKLGGQQRHVYAAGGIRDVADCEAACEAGAYGVLIATALHSEKIKADDLGVIAGL